MTSPASSGSNPRRSPSSATYAPAQASPAVTGRVRKPSRSSLPPRATPMAGAAPRPVGGALTWARCQPAAPAAADTTTIAAARSPLTCLRLRAADGLSTSCQAIRHRLHRRARHRPPAAPASAPGRRPPARPLPARRADTPRPAPCARIVIEQAVGISQKVQFADGSKVVMSFHPSQRQAPPQSASPTSAPAARRDVLGAHRAQRLPPARQARAQRADRNVEHLGGFIIGSPSTP